MTILEAITRTDALKQNTYENSDKIAWLSRLDGMIKRVIIDTHEGADAVAFGGYTDETDLETELLVPEPYDDMYIKWLEAQICYSDGEYSKYNNAVTEYNAVYQGFANFYNRTHLPVSPGTFKY